MTSQLDEFIERKVPIGILLQYYLSFFPTIIVQTSSVACLIAVLITYSSMNNQNEIIVLRSVGFNYWNITKVALTFGLLVSALVFWTNESIIPKSTEATKNIRNKHMESEDFKLKNKNDISNLTFYGSKNRLYFIDTFHPKSLTLNGITIIEYDTEQNIKQKIVALSGTWTGIAWKFYQCRITTYEIGKLSNHIKVKIYKEKLMDIKETPRDFLKQRLNVSAMNISELSEYIKRFSKSGALKALQNLKVDYHQKISFPLSNFIIIFVGIPLSLMSKNRKGSTFNTLGIAIGIGFFYYVTNAVMLAFGKGGLLPPILSAWAAPILFIGIGLALVESDFAN